MPRNPPHPIESQSIVCPVETVNSQIGTETAVKQTHLRLPLPPPLEMRTTTATPAAKINIQVELLIGVAAGVPLPAGTPKGHTWN